MLKIQNVLRKISPVQKNGIYKVHNSAISGMLSRGKYSAFGHASEMATIRSQNARHKTKTFISKFHVFSTTQENRTISIALENGTRAYGYVHVEMMTYRYPRVTMMLCIFAKGYSRGLPLSIILALRCLIEGGLSKWRNLAKVKAGTIRSGGKRIAGKKSQLLRKKTNLCLAASNIRGTVRGLGQKRETHCLSRTYVCSYKPDEKLQTLEPNSWETTKNAVDRTD